jgi:hypothetical protein
MRYSEPVATTTAGETAMQQQYIERVVDLTEPEANQIYRLSVEEAREMF